MTNSKQVIDPAVALRLHDTEGLSYRRIADRFPGNTPDAARWAVRLARYGKGRRVLKELLIDPATTLALWNSGLTDRQIAARFPGVTRSAVRYAIIKATTLGLGQARTGRYKTAPAAPPLAALWT
jgi:uncharacterized protein (DUF433 family)